MAGAFLFFAIFVVQCVVKVSSCRGKEVVDGNVTRDVVFQAIVLIREGATWSRAFRV